MRWASIALLVTAMVLTACTRSQPVPPPGPETQSGPLVEWVRLPTASRPSGAFWAPDQPAQHPVKAYGQVRTSAMAVTASEGITVEASKTVLPKAPKEVPVYVIGSYSPTYAAPQPEEVGELDCDYYPYHSSFLCSSSPPSPIPVTDATSAAARMRELIQPLWMDDWRLESPAALQADKTWKGLYRQEIEGRPFYTDKGLDVTIDGTGAVIQLEARRRPLIGRSLYPARSPEEALRLLKEGRGFAFTTVYALPPPRPNTTFIVQSVEIGHITPHVWSDNELVSPYYIFRNEAGEALVIPALSEPWTGWPLLQLRVGLLPTKRSTSPTVPPTRSSAL